jgi:hypothetical protein
MEFDTIQTQRAEERKAEALKIAAPKAKKVAELRLKASAIAAQADAAEADAIQGFLDLKSLLERRAVTLSEIALYSRLSAEVEASKLAARNAAVRLVTARDPIGQAGAMLTLDNLARLAVLAPVIPTLLDEHTATAAELGNQIQVFAREHGIELKVLFAQCQSDATNLIPGFAGLLSPLG